MMTKLAMGLCAACLAAPAAAQESGWTGAATFYGWLPAASGTIGSPQSGLTADLSAGVDDILDSLNVAFFASGEVRKGPWGIVGDVVWSDLSNAQDLAGPFATRVRGGMRLGLFTLAGSYRVFDDGRASLDALAGGRIGYASVDVTAVGGGPGGVTVSGDGSETWFDPLIGIRGRYALTDTWSVRAMADVGGFGVGSDLTWELYGGVSYAFSERWVGEFGYRFLALDLEADRVSADIQMYGPVIGLTMRF